MKSILKFIQEISRKNKMACLLSVIIGIVASVLVAVCFGYPFKIILDEGIFQKWVISNIVPFLSIILLLILLKGFSPTWKNFKARFFCILLFLLAYTYGFFVIGVISSSGTFWGLCEIPVVSFFVFIFSIIWFFADPIQSNHHY